MGLYMSVLHGSSRLIEVGFYGASFARFHAGFSRFRKSSRP